MNRSAIVMLIFGSLILYGGLAYFIFQAAKSRHRANKEEELNCVEKH
ncbi:MAG: MetS family NSS transporter small subunit [candidate division WOR-3 bacterium]|nr:MetS family NSS transporter small subunit [candidate division WOR-3 bacterium]